MRFAAVATIVTALAAAPFAATTIAGATMSEDYFVQAAECAAYAQVVYGPESPEFRALRGEVTIAQYAQSPEAVARARAHVVAIQLEARENGAAEAAARDAACRGQSSVAGHANGSGGPA